MRDIKEYIREGMFDDSAVDDGMSALLNQWLEKNCKGDFKVLKTKKKRIISGDIKITSQDKLVELCIDEVRGSIYFEKCTELTSLEGMFNSGAKVTGTLAIIDCPKFNSLAGSPWDCSVLELSNLPQLKSLIGMPEWCKEVNITRCGKRFKKEQIKALLKTSRSIINCDVEDEEPNITEAFKDPVLSKLYDAVKKFNKEHPDDYDKINVLSFVNSDWKLSEITASARKKYDVIEDDAKDWCKDLQKIFRQSDTKENGFIVGYNSEEDEVKAVYFNNYSAAFSRFTFKTGRKTSWGVNDIKYIFSKKALSDLDIDVLYVYSSAYFRSNGNQHDYELKYKIRQSRMDARAGMVDMSKDGLKKLLSNNRDRYKAAAEKLRAMRNSDEYKPLQDKVKRLMERTNKLTEKMWKDTSWTANRRYDIERTMKSMFQEYEYRQGRSYKDSYSVDGGVMYYFRLLAIGVAKLSTGEGYETEDNVNKLKVKLQDAIKLADENLTKLGL